jgi:hypothetical protein
VTDVESNPSLRLPLAVLLGIFLALGALWAALVPPFEKPDEVHHFAYVQFLPRARRLPVQAREPDPFLEVELQQPPTYYLGAAIPYGLAGRLGLPATDLHDWLERLNPRYQGRSPPLGAERNFWLQDGIGVDAGETYPFDLLLVRLFSLLLSAGTVLLSFRLARRVLPDRPWLAIGAAAAVGLLPQFTFLATSASNDSLAWLWSALYLLLLLRLRDSAPDRSGRAYLALGVAAGLAPLVKSTLYPLLPLALLVAPPGLRLGARLRGLAVWGASALLVGGWWFVRNERLYGDLLGRQEIINPALFAWNIHPKPLGSPYFAPSGPFWPKLGQSFVGYFGFVHLPLPDWAYGSVFLAAIAALAGLGLFLWRAGREARLRLGLLAAAGLLALAGVVYYNLHVDQPQGRYLFVALPALAILFVTGLAELAGRGSRDRGVAIAVAGGFLALNLYSLAVVIVPSYGAAAWALLPGH